MAIGAAFFMLAAVFAVGYAEGDGRSLFGGTVSAADDEDVGSHADLGEDGGATTTSDCPCPPDEGGPAGEGADVALQKEAEVEFHEEGRVSSATFILTVSSIGTETATNVVLTDDLPDFMGNGWELSGPDSEACTIDETDTLTCTFGDLAPGETREVRADTFACEIECGPDVVNEANVTADNDVNEANDSDTAVVPLDDCPFADVAVEKEGNLEILDDGLAKIRFVVTVTSVGDVMAQNVTLLDDLPPVHGSSWSLAGDDSEACSFDGELRVRCDFGDMAPGETRNVVFRANRCEFECGTQIENEVWVDADNDANHQNNRDTAVIEFPPCPGEGEPAGVSDVGVEKTGKIVGQEGTTAARVEYTLVVTTTGDVPSENVVLSDTLPDLGTPWELSGDTGGCELDGNQLTCWFGDIASGETRTLTLSTFECEVGCQPITNTAVVTSDNDQDGSNDEDTVTLIPDCPGDAEVQKQGEITDEHGGIGTVQYTITVRSIGQGTVRDVVLHDELPDLSTEWSVSGTHASSCQLNGDSLTCWFGHMLPGGFRSIVLTATQCELGCEAFTNTATITSKNDVVSENDEDSVTLVPTSCPDAGVQKVGEAEDQGNGFVTLQWTITVTSAGSVAVEDVTLVDHLPDIGADWSLSGADAADCTFDGETIECAFGTLQPGEERQIVVTSDVCVQDEDVTNTATVSANGDVNTGNDSATFTIPAAS